MALSSTKAESVALSEVMQEAVWLKVFMCEIGEIAKEKAVKIYDDNQGAIALSKKNKSYTSAASTSTSATSLCVRRPKMFKWCGVLLNTRHAIQTPTPRSTLK